MKYNHLYILFKKALHFKRNQLKESIIKKEKKLPQTKNKRKQLKLIYKKILTGTPYEQNIPLFEKLIDLAPDSYLSYELGMDLPNAMKMVDELIRGEGDFTPEELKNILNITNGIGFPAIEHHASAGKPMSKETQTFGAHHMDQNVKEFLGSLESRRSSKNKLPVADTEKQIGTTTPDVIHREVVPIENKISSRLARLFKAPQIRNTEFANIASQITSPGMKMDRMASAIATIITSSKTYEEAKKKAEQKLHLDFTQGEDIFKHFWKEKERQAENVKIKRENTYIKVRDFINEKMFKM